MTDLPPLSVYVHIPWCAKKCPYCDFNSHALNAELPEVAYLAALRRDTQNDLALVQNREVSSVFIGGGTPSLFSINGIAQLLEQLCSQLNIKADAEITLEANPGAVERDKFAGFKAAGINRISLGVQSFNDTHLQALGRIHSAAEACCAIDAIQAAGFSKWNVDLMHGLPGQQVEEALADVQRAVTYGAPHISWYQLTIEPNTQFFSQPPVLPGESVLGAVEQRGQELLQEHGFNQYEVSAWCRPAMQSIHNLNYWQFGDYLGIGAGAHGKMSRAGEILRLWKTRQPESYMRAGCALQAEASMRAGERVLDDTELPFEFMLNALRLNGGFDPVLFEQRTGLPLAVIELQLAALVERQLLIHEPGLIQPTTLGRRFLNDLLQVFIDG